MTLSLGQTFNESTTFEDAVTGRFSRRLTAGGRINNTLSYHINATFSADSRYLLFVRVGDGGSAVMRAELETGELAVLGVEAVPAIWAGLAQAADMVIAVVGRSLKAYGVRSGEVRTLIADCGAAFTLCAPCGTIDGKYALCTRQAARDQDVRAMLFGDITDEQAAGRPTTFLRVDLETGAVEEVHHEPVCSCNHLLPSPTDPDVWMIERDLPPFYGVAGDDGVSPRAHLLHVPTGRLTPLVTRDARRFQIHTNWSRDGRRLYYHGRAALDGNPILTPGGGQYIGVAGLDGSVLWEWYHPQFQYGHVCTHMRDEAVIVDGLISPDLVTALYYEASGADGPPHVEILARHGTNWDYSIGQPTHPHCGMSPDGRWLSYNRGHERRTDVYVTRFEG